MERCRVRENLLRRRDEQKLKSRVMNLEKSAIKQKVKGTLLPVSH
jgi:hypothetical protein